MGPRELEPESRCRKRREMGGSCTVNVQLEGDY